MAMLSGIIRTQETSVLSIARIRRDGGTQPRDGIDPGHVADIRQAIRDGVDLPAIEVTYDGQHYWLWDGYHRTAAHEAEGRTEIEAIVHQGKLEDAQWESYGVNKAHGLKRSTADKERAIRSALKHTRAAGMSDRALADHLGVSDKTVSKYRSEITSVAEFPQHEKRTGADGRSYNSTKPPKRPAPAAVPAAGSRSLTPGNVFKAVAGDPDSMDVHVMGWTTVLPQAPESAPTLRPLTSDETMSLVWRVVKAARPLASSAGVADPDRWRSYGDWIERHAALADYRHEGPEGTKLDGQTLINARVGIMATIENNIRQLRQQPAAAATEAPPVAVIDVAAETLRLPPFALDDRELFAGQVRRSIKLLDEEGCARVAELLRVVQRSMEEQTV